MQRITEHTIYIIFLHAVLNEYLNSLHSLNDWAFKGRVCTILDH